MKDDAMEHDDEPVVEVESVTQKGVVTRFGKYRSLGRIGQGGMADVFLAVGRGPAGFNKLVVIKRLRDTVASDAAFRDMFLDEARLAARLNHPNVVQTYEVFEDENAYFITMEYLEGQPLGRILRECSKRGMRLQPQICARIVSDVLCGLHYAHEACDYDGAPLHIVHRDVSPQNIFVTYDGQVKVVDFGIAKAERSNTKTQAGFFKGKAAYMAPEQLEGAAIDRRVDVFTTGIVLWELLVGKRLMAAETTAKTLVRLLRDPIPNVGELVAGVDPELDRIVSRALQRDPVARYQTAGEMRNALEQYLLERRQFVRHEEIGRLVGDVFREARAERQRQVSEHMLVASEFPRSGTTPAVSEGMLAAALPAGMDPSHPSSMSGIAVARTLSSIYAAQPPATGVAPLPQPPKGIRLSPAALAVAAVVSVAAVFTLVERTRTASVVAPPPPTVAAALSPVVTATRPPPQPGMAAAEMGVPEQARVEPPSPPTIAAPQPSPGRAVQAAPAWRPARPQWAEPRQASAPSRAAAAAPPVPMSQETSPAQTPNAADAEAGRANPGPASSPPPTPSAPATQEGRKFRTSL
jgi:serine/threonine protein kinase